MKKRVRIIAGLSFASILTASVLASCSGDGTSTTTTTGGATEENKILYVSSNADPRNGNGTEENPYSFVMAYNNATPGTTILMAGGTYEYSSRLEVGKDVREDAEKGTGRAGKYITVKPKTSQDKVVFDFSKMAFNSNNRGIQVYSNYWHFKDIEVTGAGDNGMYIAGNHNIIENCQFYNNRDTGLQIGRAYSEYNTIDLWPSYNLIKNCTSFDNYDAETYGENADGYAAKLTVGYGNVFDGCIAYRNSDDGWDLFAKVDSGDIGTVVLYNCVSFENGFLSYKNDNQEDPKVGTYDTLNGDGIGFKLGGSVMKGNVIVENCLAFNNKLHGVGDNSNPGIISVKNFTAFNNCANVDADGKITGERGLPDIANKSNNIDLARSTNSYNNYYGVLSYVNNQKNFQNEGDSEYNKDAFRGSTAYSIFNTDYNKGEIYKAFTGYEDASSWHTDSVDRAYSSGTEFTGMSDSIFADLKPINAVCDSRADLANLLSIHTTYRNADGSVNMGDKVKLVDPTLLKYANGNPIGAQLSKSSMEEYTHYPMFTFENSEEMPFDKVKVLSAYSVCEIIANKEAVFQNFKLAKLIAGANISWSSDNENVIAIDNNEEKSKSDSVFSTGVVSVPENDTKVKITATISAGDYETKKEFEVTVKGRNQRLGSLASTGTSAIRVNIYSEYTEPTVYALDESAITISEFPKSLYTISNSYKYATDRNSKFYGVDGVYTSVPGVYEVTVTAVLKSDASVTSSMIYRVYVVDPDSNINFTLNGSDPNATISLSSTGFDITGSLSNIEGSVIAISSTTPITGLTTAKQLLEHKDANNKSDVQKVKIVTDEIVASFKADNETVVTGTTQYYIYYAVVNGNESAKTDNNPVYTSSITVMDVSTNAQFYNLARYGKLDAETNTNTIIYSLTKDLDFTDFKWYSNETVDGKKVDNFTGLFRGNGHTIKNVTVIHDEADTDKGRTATTNKSVNMFFKVKNGTIMDVNFEDISITASTSDDKQVGIVGELQGGYISNVHVKRVSACGKESVGGIVGQITGGDNYITKCSFINPISEDLSADKLAEYTEEQAQELIDKVNEKNAYQIKVANKYAGGIVGNAQKNSDQSSVSIHISNCYANGIIGDGNDAAGNMALILGRVKNDSSTYLTEITQCVAYGFVISKGQYTAGIVGDFDNGQGTVKINRCLADVEFIYQGKYLNATVDFLENAECQNYAHKNSNPIVGRSVSSDGIYETSANLGSWTEYYSTYIFSNSLVFDLSDTEDDIILFELDQTYAQNILELDFDNIWKFENGKVSMR